MNKRICTALAAVFSTACAIAAVPLRWTVDTSKFEPAVFDVVRGETVELIATMQSYGKPFDMTGKAVSIYWQTNGMDSAWWTGEASTKPYTYATGGWYTDVGADTTNVVAAVFTPEMDPGASVVNGFIGSTGDVYRAAFALRFRRGPGATPNLVTMPPRILDLANTTVINAPWPTDETIDDRIRSVIEADDITANIPTNMVSETVSNIVTKAYVEDLGISVGPGGTDGQSVTNIVKSLIVSPDSGDGFISTDERAASVGRVRKELDGKADGISSSSTAIRAYISGVYKCFWINAVPYSSITKDDFLVYSTGAKFKIWQCSVSGSSATLKVSPVGISESYATTITINLSSPSGYLNAAVLADNLSASAITSLFASNVFTNSVNSIGDARYASIDTGNTALSYASGVYNYMNANTNAWFSGTNYVVGSAASTRHKFAFEDGMDLTTVPCSMSLFENRDGSKQCVWDQRDWTAWYWSFKASQMKTEIAATNAAIYTAISGRAPAAWATRTAATGLVNPDATTAWVDTDKVTLAPGMAWETVATVSGCAYWTIVGRNVHLGGSGSSSVFQIKDFEGNSVMKITKTASYLTYLEAGSDIYTSGRDADGRVTFTMRTNVKPTAEFSTVLSEDTFIAEGEDGCPANCEWEQVADGYRCHFIIKPGIVSNACFARFKVEVQGSTTIEYEDGVTIKGGLIYNDVKIMPVIPANAANGTTITWKVVR